MDAERLASLRDLLARSPIARNFGLLLDFDEQGCAVVTLPHNPALEHAHGDTHGGVLATLLATAGWYTAAARYQRRVLTTDLQLRLLEPAGRQLLCARGLLLRRGRRQAVVQVEVRDEGGRLVASGSGNFATTERPL